MGERGGAASAAKKRPRAKLEDYYVLKRELGRGHYAIVYLAVDKRTGKEVAVKRIPKSRSNTKKLVNEVKAMRASGATPTSSRSTTFSRTAPGSTSSCSS